MRRNPLGRAGPPRGIRSWPGMPQRADARNDTQQARLLEQEKAAHPEGAIPEVQIGRAGSKTEQTIGSGATVDILDSEGESTGSVTGGSSVKDTDTFSEVKKSSDRP